MRIGMILDNVYPPDPRVENEAIELIKEGHEVFLFCLTYGKELKEELVNTIQVRRYPTNTFEYKMSALVYTIPVYSYLMKKKIRKFLLDNDIEVIHIHDIRIAEAAFLANEDKLPIVLDLHENRPEIMRFYPHMQKLRGKLFVSIKKWKKKEEEFIRKATQVIVVTNEAKEEIVERVGIDGDKIVVVPNTVRTSFFESNKYSNIDYVKKEDEFTILYLGDTGTRRGLDTVFKSIVEVKSTISNLKFVVVGKTSVELERRVKELGVENEVVLMGWQKDTTFPAWIRIADVCVSPLHRNIHHDTTYANKIFQYMSLGKAVLVSDATAQKEVVEKFNSGLVHEAKNVEDFTEKIVTLFENKELREMLGNHGKEFIKNQFTWDITSKELKEFYNKLA